MDRVEQSLRELTPAVARLVEVNTLARELREEHARGSRVRLTWTQTLVAVLAIAPGVYAAIHSGLT